MRWADMDLLGHVNNVTYVDYLQEARIDMLAAHAPVPGTDALAEGVVVVRHDVTFVAPLVFRPEPVSIECWVVDVRAATFTVAYEIFDETPEGRLVYLRATSVLAPYVFAEERPRRVSAEERAALAGFLEDAEPDRPIVPHAPASGGRHVYDLFVRFSDVDAYGHVNNVKYVEFFQEARISYLTGLHRPEDGPWQSWVVARTDVEYLRPVHFSLDAYAVDSWVHRVGRSSAELCSQIRSGEQVLARARVVMVAFDRETQRSAAMPAHQRERLLAEVTPPAS